MKIKQINPKYVEYIPEEIAEGVLYISEQYRTAVHKCCCGCGQEVVTPLSPAEWTVRCNGGRVSLSPSVGNWSYPCRSHYVIRNGRVVEAEAMTERQIQQVKANDRADRTDQIRHSNNAKEQGALISKEKAKITFAPEKQQSRSWLQRLIRWWKSL